MPDVKPLLPYIFLVIATLAQLAIPALIASIINAVTNGYIATQILQALNQIPQQFMSAALPKILTQLSYPGNLDKRSTRSPTQCKFGQCASSLDLVCRCHLYLRGIPRRFRFSASLLGRKEFAIRGV